MEYIKVKDLHEYPINATMRSISGKNYKKLKDSIMRDGLTTPFLVWKDPSDNKWIVVDGNHRYKAFMDMGWTEQEIRCDRIEFVKEPEGWCAFYEGSPQRTKFFQSIEQGLLWYSLQRNNPGYAIYNKEYVINYMDQYNLPYEEFTILTEELPTFKERVNASVNLNKVMDKLEAKGKEDFGEKKIKEIDIICPHCGKSFKKEI